MKAIVVGRGRMGHALEQAIRLAGHDVMIMSSNYALSEAASPAPRQPGGKNHFDRRAGDSGSDAEPAALLLASRKPRWSGLQAMAHRYPEAVILSVVGGTSISNVREAAPGHPCARFSCSTAVRGGESLDSLRFFDETSDAHAVDVLKTILPADSWRAVASNEFDRYEEILTIAGLACGLLAVFAHDREELSEKEKVFAAEALREGAKLLESWSFDPGQAFASALTPSGITQGLFRRYFKDEVSVLVNKTLSPGIPEEES